MFIADISWKLADYTVNLRLAIDTGSINKRLVYEMRSYTQNTLVQVNNQTLISQLGDPNVDLENNGDDEIFAN